MPSSHDFDAFVSLSEAVKIKQVSRQAVYDAIKAGRLPSQTILGRTVVRRSDLKSWQIVGRRHNKPLSAEHKAKLSKSLKRFWTKQKADPQ